MPFYSNYSEDRSKLIITNIPAIELKDVSYRYPRTDRWVLKHIHLKINAGEMVAIMGENGAGKSTLCQMMNGIIPNSLGGRLSGQVLIHGIDTKESHISSLATKVGIVLEDPETQLFTNSVKSEVAFGPENLSLPVEEIEERVTWALKVVGLAGYEQRLPVSLSGGQKQRLAIAANLAMRPDILVLDEATSQLDPVGVEEVLGVVRELNQKYGMTIMMATDASEMIAMMMDRVIVLNEGQIEADGTPRQIFANKSLFNRIMIRSPQVSQLAVQLSDHGYKLPTIPITVPEACDALKSLLPEVTVENTAQPLDQILAESSFAVPKGPEKEVIIVDHLDYVYQPLNVHAVKSINFSICQGEFVALIGQNGSGKTTVLKNMLGLLRPTSGRVVVAGMDTAKTAVAEIARHVGFVLQNPDQQLFAETVEEEVAYGPKNLKMEKGRIEVLVSEALELVGLADKRKEFPPALPKGERAKVVIASALALNPSIIVLDEPTTGQDYRGCHQIMQIAHQLHEQGRTVVFVTHHMALVSEYAQRVIVLSDGEVLLDDVTESIFSLPEVIRKTHIIPPQITVLGQSLPITMGLPRTPLTVECVYSAVINRLNSHELQ